TTINHSSNNDSEYESEMDANEKSNDPDLMKHNDSTLSNKKKRLSALKNIKSGGAATKCLRLDNSIDSINIDEQQLNT
ncbi:unnamed protein product, partial [Rotaria magnacalcarata]